MTFSDQILSLEAARIDAINENRIEDVGMLLHADYLHVHANGKVQNLAEYLVELADVPRRTDPRQPRVERYGDAAFLSGEMINHFRFPTGEKTLRFFVTQLAVQTDAGWKFVSYHAVFLPDDMPLVE